MAFGHPPVACPSFLYRTPPSPACTLPHPSPSHHASKHHRPASLPPRPISLLARTSPSSLPEVAVPGPLALSFLVLRSSIFRFPSMSPSCPLLIRRSWHAVDMATPLCMQFRKASSTGTSRRRTWRDRLSGTAPARPPPAAEAVDSRPSPDGFPSRGTERFRIPRLVLPNRAILR